MVLFVIKGCQTCVAEDLETFFLASGLVVYPPRVPMCHAVAHSLSCPVHGEENQKKVSFVSQYKNNLIIEIKSM